MLSLYEGSETKNLSLGERPVYFPVLALTAPSSVNTLRYCLRFYYKVVSSKVENVTLVFQ